MNGESYRLKQSRQAAALRPAADLPGVWTPPASLPLRAPGDTHRRRTAMMDPGHLGSGLTPSRTG